jgi:sugar diacid utilization regulator
VPGGIQTDRSACNSGARLGHSVIVQEEVRVEMASQALVKAEPIEELAPLQVDEAVLRHVLNASCAMRRMEDPEHVLDILVSTLRLVVPTAGIWGGRQAGGAPPAQVLVLDHVVAAADRAAPAAPEAMAAMLERWSARIAEGHPAFEIAGNDTPFAAMLNPAYRSQGVTVMPMSSPGSLGAVVLAIPEATLTGFQLSVIGLLCERASMALDLASSRAAAQHTEALFETVTQLTASHLDPDQVLQTVVRRTAELLGTDTAHVMLADESKEILTVRTAYGITRRSFYEATCRADELLPGAAIRTRRVVCTRDMHDHERAKHSRPEGLRSAMCAPMFVDDELIGVLMAAHREVRDISREDRRMMAALAAAAAVSVANARLHAEREASMRRLAGVNRLVQERSAALEKTIQFQQALTALVLEGGGLEAVVRVLTEGLGRAVLILDRDLAVLHASAGADSADGAVDLGTLRDAVASLEHEAVESGVTRLTIDGDGQELQLLVAPLHLAGDRSAFVVVVEGEAHLDGTDLGMTEAAVTAIGLELMRDRASAEAEARVTGGLFQMLLSADDVDEALIARRASYLGYDLSGTNVVIAISAADECTDAAGRRNVSLQTCVQRAVRRRREAPTAVFERDNAICVVLSDPDSVPAEIVSDLCGLIKQELEVSGRRAGARIAHAGPHRGIAGIRRAVTESEYALHVLGVVGTIATPVAFGDLGVWSLLGRVGDRAHLTTFADSVLGELVAHDAERSSQLVETLRALVECNFHYRSAAEALFAHPNTLRYRITRIGELTGLDLANSEDRLKVELALRVLDVIELTPRAA